MSKKRKLGQSLLLPIFTLPEVYYPMQWTPGTHTVKMVFNENQAFPESNFSNNEHTFSYKIIAETTPPTFSIRGPELINGQTCLTVENLSDNKSVYTDVWPNGKLTVESGLLLALAQIGDV